MGAPWVKVQCDQRIAWPIDRLAAQTAMFIHTDWCSQGFFFLFKATQSFVFPVGPGRCPSKETQLNLVLVTANDHHLRLLSTAGCYRCGWFAFFW